MGEHSLGIRVSQEGADATASALGRVAAAGGQAENSFMKLALQIAGFTSLSNMAVQGVQRIGAAIVDTAKQSVALAASFEKSRMTWGVLVGDMEKGSIMFDKLFSFAAKTPLSFEGINHAATTLKAYGMATEDLIPTMKILGDVAMGDNAKLGSISLAYGQIMSTGRLMGQDLLQLVNQGFNPLSIISERTGESMATLKKRMEAGGISAKEVADAFKIATSEGGLFFQMMDKTATTTEGKLSTLRDNWKAVLADIGTTTLPAINQALDDINRSLEGSILKSQTLKYLQTGKGDPEGIVEGLERDIARQKAILNDPGNRMFSQEGRSDASRLFDPLNMQRNFQWDLSHTSSVKLANPLDKSQSLNLPMWSPMVNLMSDAQDKLATDEANLAAVKYQSNYKKNLGPNLPSDKPFELVPGTAGKPAKLADWQTLFQKATKGVLKEESAGYTSDAPFLKDIGSFATYQADWESKIPGSTASKGYDEAIAKIKTVMTNLGGLGYKGKEIPADLSAEINRLEALARPLNQQEGYRQASWSDVEKTPWGPPDNKYETDAFRYPDPISYPYPSLEAIYSANPSRNTKVEIPMGKQIYDAEQRLNFYGGNRNWGLVSHEPATDWIKGDVKPYAQASWSDVPTRTGASAVKSAEVVSYERTHSAVEALNNSLDDLASGEDKYGAAAKRSAGWTEREISAFKNLSDEARKAQWLKEIKDDLVGIAANGVASTFSEITQSLLEGSNASDTFAEGMSKIGASVTQQMGGLMTTVGLKMLVETSIYNPVGWALIVGGGVISGVGAAWASSGSNSSNGTATAAQLAEQMSALTQYYQAAEQFNAQGAAKGSLHGYAGGTNYAMGGWAMVGERGPELMRVPSGSQIVPNHLIGGYANGLNIPGGTTVNIINNAGASVSSEEGMDANGAKMIVVTIEKAVASAIAKGKMDGPMRSRYGARYVGRSTT